MIERSDSRWEAKDDFERELEDHADPSCMEKGTANRKIRLVADRETDVVFFFDLHLTSWISLRDVRGLLACRTFV